jgi:hypothetical protein
MQHGHRHEDLVAQLDAEKETRTMLHNHPPGRCWCGDKHTHGQVYDLNVLGRADLPPDSYDTLAADAIADEMVHQRAADIAATGGWNLLTDAEVERLTTLVEKAGGPEALTIEQVAEIFRGEAVPRRLDKR